MSIQSINPVNGKIIKNYKEHTLKQINKKIGATHDAW